MEFKKRDLDMGSLRHAPYPLRVPPPPCMQAFILISSSSLFLSPFDFFPVRFQLLRVLKSLKHKNKRSLLFHS